MFSEYALIKYRVLVEIRWLQVRPSVASDNAERMLQRGLLI